MCGCCHFFFDLWFRGGDRIRTCASVKEPPCPHGRKHHLDLLVVRRLNYAVCRCRHSVSLIITPSGHIRRRSSAPAFGMAGISLPCFLTGSDFRLIAVQLHVPQSPDGGRLSAMVLLTGSLNEWLNAVQPASVPSESNKSMNSAAPLRAICSAGWYCANDLRGYPALCALHC